MGKSETASAALGIKILLSDLIPQINETNFNLIKKMLYDGFIEDSNDYYNEAYKNVLGYDDGDIEVPLARLQSPLRRRTGKRYQAGGEARV